ncbi:MAG: YIEGIA domain-containing protein [Clostridiaceae bacterium]
MEKEALSLNYIIIIVVPLLCGTIARYRTLIVDYRQYPSYPSSYLIHLVTGFVAAAIGAIAIPALLERNFEAVTFLFFAIEQFREVRRIEKESLQDLDNVEHVFRGAAYIDGIAKTFEERNYFALVVSFVASLTMHIVPDYMLWVRVLSGIVAGVIVFIFLKYFFKGKTLGDVADVKLANIKVVNSELYVDDIFITNHLGLDSARKLVQAHAIAAIISPHERSYSITLDHYGQRQAIIFEVCRVLGLRRYHYTKRHYETGRIAVVMVPILEDKGAFIETIKKTPLLDNIKKSKSIM